MDAEKERKAAEEAGVLSKEIVTSPHKTAAAVLMLSNQG